MVKKKKSSKNAAAYASQTSLASAKAIYDDVKAQAEKCGLDLDLEKVLGAAVGSALEAPLRKVHQTLANATQKTRGAHAALESLSSESVSSLQVFLNNTPLSKLRELPTALKEIIEVF